MKFKIQNSKFKILILFFSCLLFSGCQPQQKTRIVEVQEAIPVKVVKIELQDFDETIDYVGNIKAQDEAVVYPKVSGKIIEKIKEEASIVTKGEVIAYIDRDEVGLKFEKAPIESPISGVVRRIYVDLGENVTIQTPVALVVNMEKVKVELNLPEKYLPLISLGQLAKISIDAYPQEEFTGMVSKISPVVDLITRTAPIEIILDNPQSRLKSGMFARVRLILKSHKNAPLVIKEAVMGRQSDNYVYVIEDNRAVLKRIILGVRQDSYYEVKEGLKEGDLVVIVGQQRLYEGAKVLIEE
ncbi:MAG: efflux RND transporter periplasmic adaptor subunit [Candidatus Omnitrophica bacterium]|nr:efflux RND transporter periplasmic adaptor subunit [Candidatus Omnitrophota bacterium]